MYKQPNSMPNPQFTSYPLNMRAFNILWLSLVGLLASITVSCTDNGKTTAVTWDKYSLSVNGERLFIFSGEFHYHRLPVPEMWLDVFQKLRANGFNAVSSIVHHSLSIPSISIDTRNADRRLLQSTSSGTTTVPPKTLSTSTQAPTTSNGSSTTPINPDST